MSSCTYGTNCIRHTGNPHAPGHTRTGDAHDCVGHSGTAKTLRLHRNAHALMGIRLGLNPRGKFSLPLSSLQPQLRAKISLSPPASHDCLNP